MDKVSMFEHSRSLIAGAKIIISSEGIEEGGIVKRPAMPVVLCCSFAIEICLKLLLLAETGKKEQGHNLKDLFYKLPVSVQIAVLQLFLINNPDESADSFRVQLAHHEDAFVKWRYAFETEGDKECSPSFLYCFAFSLSSYIEENYKFKRSDNGWL